ncbi:hypothetical protein MRX96_040874 [Rhipicephalus microplus]
MPVVADIDGVQTEIFPIVDEFGVIVFDGDAELYATTDNFGKACWTICPFTDGRQVRVVSASGRLANADPTNEHAMPAMPTTQPTPPNNAEPTMQASAAAAAALSPGRARRDDSEEALWSSRRTRFLIEKYKENFRNIGKKGGLREPEARVQAAAPASQESSAEETAEVQKRKAKDPPLVQLLQELEEIEKKQG